MGKNAITLKNQISAYKKATLTYNTVIEQEFYLILGKKLTDLKNIHVTSGLHFSSILFILRY